jgi:hypothetical protein
MSKAKRKTVGESTAGKVSAPRSQTAVEAQNGTADPVARILAVLVLALVVVRWLIPAESAPDGETLWIVQLWLAAGLLWAWGCFRSGSFALRLGAFDAALWTLIAGHVLSTAVVFLKGGDRRTALNMTWEWIGLGTTFFLLRQVAPPISRHRAVGAARGDGPDNRLATIVATLGIVFAGLGIWQHYVYYPRAYDEYRGMLNELETLRKDPVANARRIGQAELKFQAQGVPSEEAGRRQFENRLRFSNEPFGPFALANTFAGFLVVALVLAGDLFRGACRPQSNGRLSKSPLSRISVAAWAAAFLLLVYCLVLTKSRTAWIALVVALAFWGGCSIFRARAMLRRRTALLVAAVGAAIAATVVVLFVVAALGGGFDVQVISEAPKSFEYRLQYWTGAMGVVREQPIFGTGPGNFRQHYLHYKVPESSEEIADPHNLILDLWTSGGLLAVAAFFGCVIFAVVPFLRRRTTAVPDEAAPPLTDFAPWSAVLPGASVGFLLAILAPVLSGSGDFDTWTILLFVGWLIAFLALRGNLSVVPLSAAALGGAAMGLTVHLLDLGGIEMPAVVQLFLVIVASAFATLPDGRSAWESRKAVLAVSGAAIVLFIACLGTATLPVLNRRALVASGDQALMVDGDADRAIRDFGAAAIRDPFSRDPPEKLAEAFFSRWQLARPDTAAIDYFAKAKHSLEIAISLDPFNPRLYRRLGEMYVAKFARSGDRHDAQAAADALTQAVARYPNDSSLCALRATALSAAGEADAAKAEAERALKLDQINRQRAHTDRYLPDAKLIQLHRLATPSAH